MNRRERVALLLTLYFAQGLPYGLFGHALPVILRQQGHSLEHIGLSNLLALPWALKFLWAGPVDRVSGHRRRVILPLNVAAAALLLVLAAVSPGSVLPLVLVVLGCNLVAATSDIATDGYAVELLDERDRGLGNGVQVGGYRLGMVVGGGVLLSSFAVTGWAGTFALAAACVALACLPLAVAPETPRAAPPGADARPGDHHLHRWFAVPGGGRWFALLVTYKLGDALGTGMVKPMLVDMGLGLADVGRVVGVYGSAASILGALAGGLLVQRLGTRAGLALFALGQGVAVGGWAVVAALGPDHWALAAVAEHLVSGMATSALFTAMMYACRRDRPGADYTVQASVVVIAQGLAAIASGWTASELGYVGHGIVATFVCLAPLLLVLRWPREAPERFALR